MAFGDGVLIGSPDFGDEGALPRARESVDRNLHPVHLLKEVEGPGGSS